MTRRIKKVCSECGKLRDHFAHGLCGACYNRWYFKTHLVQNEKRKEWGNTHKKEKAGYSRASYARNREKVNKNTYARFRRYRMENLAFLQSLVPMQCAVCGYNKCFEALDLHHILPNQKTHHGDKLSAWLYQLCPTTFQRKITNIKFQMLCSNCHRELHAKEHNASYKEF